MESGEDLIDDDLRLAGLAISLATLIVTKRITDERIRTSVFHFA